MPDVFSLQITWHRPQCWSQCTWCHGDFLPSRPDRLYCSDSCRDAMKNAKNPNTQTRAGEKEAECGHCHQTFRYQFRGRMPRRYCSKRCRIAAMNARAKRPR